MSVALLCKHPFYLPDQGFFAPCGHCAVCRSKKKKEWSIRMLHESSIQGHDSLFVTLTYRNEDLPPNRSLSKRDVQLFFKRLRKALPNTPFRYYVGAEYGPLTDRPHYHLVLIGLKMRHAPAIFNAWGKCDSPHFHCEIPTSLKAFGYVAGYTAKKFGEYTKQKWLESNPDRECPFQLVSKGMGKGYIMAEGTRQYALKTGMYKHNGLDKILPRYYRKVLGIDASVYAEMLFELNESIFEYIVEETGRLPTDYFLARPNDTIPPWNGHLVSRLFYEELDKYRQYCDYQLRQTIKKWREQI